MDRNRKFILQFSLKVSFGGLYSDVAKNEETM